MYGVIALLKLLRLISLTLGSPQFRRSYQSTSTSDDDSSDGELIRGGTYRNDLQSTGSRMKEWIQGPPRQQDEGMDPGSAPLI
jgi:hypothetical protein